MFVLIMKINEVNPGYNMLIQGRIYNWNTKDIESLLHYNAM